MSDNEAKTFYEANKAMVGEQPFEQVKEAIQQVLVQQKRQDAFASYLQGMGGKADIRVNREWVKAQHLLAKDNPVDKARMSGKPTMVDLGANECIPCKMMVPVMEKVEKKYQGKAAIIFIDVWKNKEPAKRFGIRAIPTQIFLTKRARRSTATLVSWARRRLTEFSKKWA